MQLSALRHMLSGAEVKEGCCNCLSLRSKHTLHLIQVIFDVRPYGQILNVARRVHTALKAKKLTHSFLGFWGSLEMISLQVELRVIGLELGSCTTIYIFRVGFNLGHLRTNLALILSSFTVSDSNC